MAAEGKKAARPNPFLSANCLSKIFFWWLADIIWHTNKHDFGAGDLYDTTPKDLSESLTCTLESNWIEEVVRARKRNKKPSLWKVIMRTYGWDFMKISILPICYIGLQTIHPQLLQLILMYFQPESTITSQWVYVIATMFIFIAILRTIFITHGQFYHARLGMKAKIACTSLIYRKLLRLSSSAKQKLNSSVISLLSVDVTKFHFLFTYASFILITPVYFLIGTYLISQYVGVLAAVVGVALLILLSLPIQAVSAKMTLKYRAKQAMRTDYRILLISEIFHRIRAVKMYVWENFLEKSVFIARNLEIQNYLKISYLMALVLAIASMSHRFSTVAINSICGIVTTDKILPVFQHLFHMRTCTVVFFVQGIRYVIDMCVSIKRIEEFLLLEEVKDSFEDDYADELISIENVTAFWDKKSTIFKEISLDFSAKKLYAVVGSVGSGKSSLLHLILGELPTASGKVSVHRRVSYASQEAWLFNGSIRDNILFGEVYNGEKYEKTINACALGEDFSQLSYGDKTLVGERGSNLSGGQRARVNLARAVYREADVYLLDDPLSAVDAHVGKQIMKDCVNGLLRHKTRILIAHGIQQLEDVAEIILLEHGNIEFRGSIEEFRRNDQRMARLITDETELLQENKAIFAIDKPDSIGKPASTDNGKEPKESEELLAKGAMKSSVYLSYIKAGGWNWLFLVTLTNILFVILTSILDFELATWNNNKNISSNNATVLIEDIPKLQSSFEKKYILIFGGLIIIIIFISILKGALLCRLTFNASKNIHNDIFSRLMTTHLRFFEANSTGKILNRFSEDTGIIDNALPQVLTITVHPIFQAIAIFTSTIIANWWMIIPGSVLVFIASFVGKIYVRTSQSIKRLSVNAKSPILSLVASSMEGGMTIRACKAEHIITKDFNILQDRCTAAEFLIVALPEAFCLWVEFITIAFLASVTFFFVITKDEKSVDSYVGLTLIQILFLSEIVSYQVLRVADVLAHMTSVERMLQFKELQQESLVEDEPTLEIPSFWPNKGEIVFEHIYLRYSDENEPVLWDINCRIEAGSKVGIVGRTGAGKSSIISALFRFAQFDGSLLVDGLDIKRIHLYELRSKISVIPQEPVLFKTSLRKNLDPFDKFDDCTLYSALESVELKSTFVSLEDPIERGGSNLSIGQRQLLCLARAVINKNKILILDEATSNIDSLTDTIIQKTIRNEFEDCTVLTIAHRLNTVMNSDKILVMDAGRLIDYDHPFVLLQNKEGHLYKMVEQGGEAAIKNLTAIAKQSYDKLKISEEKRFNDEVEKVF